MKNAALIKQARRTLMEVLELYYPVPVRFDTLCGTLPRVEIDIMQRDVCYLIDAGYLLWINEERNMPWAKRELKLSKSGMDVAQNIKTDPTLEP